MTSNLMLLAAALLLAGCAASPGSPPPAALTDWHAVALPGKRHTSYRWSDDGGRRVLTARADRSASLLRRRVNVAPRDLGTLAFSWRVEELCAGASVADADREDAAARVVLAFEGDRGRLSARNRALFDLAEALSGESPPYATLMYVWDNTAPVGTVIINPRTDRVRKIVVDSGAQHLGHWRSHRRDVAADFRLAFGEDPGALVSLAVMTDSDNTSSTAAASYGPIDLR